MPVIRRTVQTTNRPIGVQRMDTGADEVARAVQEAGETLRRTAYETAAKKAQVKGEEAAMAASAADLMSFKDGKPVAVQPPEGFGEIARESYRRVIERRFMETMDNDIRLKAKELAVQYDRNPMMFESAMNAYIEGMAKNSEGRFQTFVAETGSAIKEATHLGLVESARNRARQAAAEHIVMSNNESEDLAAGFAAGGNLDRAKAIITEREAATKEGEGAGLKVGASQATNERISGTVAHSYINGKLSTLSQLQRQVLITAINSGDKSGVAKGGKVDAILNKVGDLITAGNKTQVLARIESVNSDLDRIKAIKDAEQRQADAVRREQSLYSLETGSQETFIASTKAARDAFMDGGDIDRAVQSASNDHGSNILNVGTYQDDNPAFSSADRLAAERRSREAAMTPFIVQAAAQGNGEVFKSALVSNNPMTEGLTEQQQETIIALHRYNLFDGSQDDIAFVSPIISSASSSQLDALKKQDQIVGFDQEAQQIATDVLLGNQGQKEIDAFLSKYDKSGLGAELGARFESMFRVAQGRNNLSGLASTAKIIEGKSSVIEAMAQYIDSGVKNNLPEKYASAIDARLEGMTVAERDAMASHLDGMAQDFKAEETKQAKQNKLMQKQVQFGKGLLDSSKKETQDIAQGLVDQLGFDIANDQTWTPQAIAVMAKGLPTNVKVEMEALASGKPTANAQNVARLYEMLTEYEVGGLTYNALTDVISGEKQAALNKMFTGIEAGLYANFNEAATEVGKLINVSPKAAKENVAAFFTNDEGKKVAPSKYAAEVIGEELDRFAARELGELATLMVGQNYTREEIDAQLQMQYENRYDDAVMVYDTSRPIGAKAKSRNAIGAIIKDPEAQKHFTMTVDAQLKEMGFALYDHVNKTGVHSHTSVESDGDRFFRPVVLVPMTYGARPSDQTFMAYEVVQREDGFREIVPVPLPSGGIAGFRISEELANYTPEAMKGKSLEELSGQSVMVEAIQKGLY